MTHSNPPSDDAGATIILLVGIMPSLRDHLAASRVLVTPGEYAASAALDSRQRASWALWGATTGDLSLFQDSRSIAPRLRKDVVLIGANFGLGGEAEDFKPFQNFHASTSGGDTKFRRGLTGTVLEGAFLTDLVKDYPTKYANGLKAEIKTGRLDTNRYVATGF
jgi:hypothetical protein